MELKREIRSPATVVCLLMLSFSGVDGLAFRSPTNAPLPNFDMRARRAAAGAAVEHRAAAARLTARVPDSRIDFDEVLGTPKWISSRRGFLSGPKGQGGGISPTTAASFAANDPYRATKAFLKDHQALFGHGPEVLADARLKREFIHNGMRTVVWEQQLDDIPIFEALLISHTTRNEELVNLSSHFIPNPAQADAESRVQSPESTVQSRGLRTQDSRLRTTPLISAREAIAFAAGNIGEKLAAAEIIAFDAQAEGAEKRQHFRAPPLNGEASVHLVWLPMNRTRLRLAWEVILTSHTRAEMFRLLIDAQTGEVLVRHCLTNYISDATYRVFTSDSPTPFSPGYSTPLTSQPPLVSRTLVVTNAFSTNASPNGWIDDGVNETRGNNVDAHTDRDNNDIADKPRPQGSPIREFDFPLDLAQAPSTYTNAAIVQLFYLCNWYHDRLYELGFTEAAGNFQTDNFGRGGAGNDPVEADAQDGGGVNNANFDTPPDGYSGRMQMYIWNGPNPSRDGAFDAEIVFHEHTHGVSSRRVGGGVGISALQSAGLGEGWSDFCSLALLSESGDNVNGNYAEGGYATYHYYGLTENYYFGIRRYPYSTDMAKNPLTFKDIDPGQASGHAGVPLNPLDSPFDASDADEVHNQGEVWCVTLWEARANFITKYGFAMGNELMLQLVIDGMNLSPANPDFLQARNAIIQADLVNNGGANHNELWAAFAKRGMGFSATCPSSVTTAGVLEAFDLPDSLNIAPGAGFTASGPVGGPFSVTSQTYILTNIGSNTITWTATKASAWLSLSPTNGSLSPGGTSNAVIVSLDASANSLAMGIYADTVRFTNQSSGVVQTREFALRVGQPDYFTEFFEGVAGDLANQTFTFTPDCSISFFSVCRQPATNFPTDPTGGIALSLTDDSFTNVTLSDGQSVSLYGVRTNSFFIGSNGYITLGSGDNNYAESLAAHFNQLRISGLFRDFNPDAGGTISWQQLSNRVAVSFFEVPEFGEINTNTFQIEMFFDGTIRLTYLRLDTTSGLVGLSRGTGVAAGFVQSDFSDYAVCVSNNAPAISDIAGQATSEDVATSPIAFTIGDVEPPADALTVIGSSSDTNLVPDANITFGGAGTNRTVTITPATNQFGAATITVTVCDGSASVSDTFVLTINPVNDPPVLAAIDDRTITESGTLSFTNTATDVEPSSAQVITDFESFTNGTADGTVMFQNPLFSGSTSNFLGASPNTASVTDTFPDGHAGDKVLKVAWRFSGSAVDPWLRLTTFDTPNLPNPTVAFGHAVMFDVYTEKGLEVGIGLRETDTTAAIGANGGTNGAIEFIGTPTQNGSTPVPSRTVAAGTWTTLRFNLPVEPIVGFTGNGILESTTGKGVLEHLTLVSAGDPGAYNIYLDNFVVASNSLSFSLDPGAPAGASINPTTGVFTWTPSQAQAPGNYVITVRVTDGGAPGLSDSKSFTVTVVSRPVIQAITVSEETVTIIWSATTGRSYRVQYKDNLTDVDWNDLWPDVAATGPTAAESDAIGSVGQRFYRVVALP